MRAPGRARGSPLIVSASLAILGSTLVLQSAERTAGRSIHAGVADGAGLRVRQSSRVSGRIVAHDGRQLLAGAVMMAAEFGERGAIMSVRDVLIGPDGLFLFRNVAPGRYVIRALGETDREGASLYGASSATVENENADGIIIVLTPGAVVEGRLELEGSSRLQLEGEHSPRVRAVATDGIPFGDALSEPIERSGHFHFRGIMPGEHVFRAEGLPDPWTLRAVYLDGREITDVPIQLRSSQRVRNLRIVVRKKPNMMPLDMGAGSPHESRAATRGPLP